MQVPQFEQKKAVAIGGYVMFKYPEKYNIYGGLLICTNLQPIKLNLYMHLAIKFQPYMRYFNCHGF